MITKVRRYIESLSLLDKQAKHLVALSGGADSVCLLLVLKSLGYNVEAIHCNFHLRGEESDRDENFCKTLCYKNNIPFHIVHFDTHAYAELHKVSIEMAARDLRYAYFERLRKDIDAADICVAHHKDDNVETIFMNIIRGTGLTGLIGMRPKNGFIIRPFLCITRSEIINYLTSINQDYVTDSTNLIDDVTRNKIRLNIIPMLEEINPQLKENVSRMTQWLSDVEKITNASIKNTESKIVSHLQDGVTTISIDELALTPSPRYVLFTLLHPYGFTTDQIRDIADVHHSGTIWQSNTHTLVVDHGNLLLAETPKSQFSSMKIPEDGTYVISNGAKLKLIPEQRTANFEIPKEAYNVAFDAMKVSFPLTLRHIKDCDRFAPYGMRGTKLVSDYLTDRKRNYFQRQRQLVLTDANGEIIWLIGERVSSKVCITDETIKCLHARYINNE